MSYKKRKFTVVGFNLATESFSTPTGCMVDKPSYAEVEVENLPQAITAMLTGEPFDTMSYKAVKGESNLTAIDTLSLNIEMDLAYEMMAPADRRVTKAAIDAVVRSWAEKIRVKNTRGWRSYAVKDSVIALDKNGDRWYNTQLVLSNVAVYSGYGECKKISVNDMIKDLQLLLKELNKRVNVIGIIRYNHSSAGRGEVV